MGQRTAIIVKYDNECFDDHKVEVYYNQWGIGRACLANVMGLLYGTFNSIGYKMNLRPANTLDVTEDIKEEALKAVSFDEPKAVGEVMKWCSNNNGGCFIHINDTGSLLKGTFRREIKYAFMLGYEEGGKYNKFCTLSQFVKKVGGKHTDKEFMQLFNATMQYFGAVDYAEEVKKTKKQIAA